MSKPPAPASACAPVTLRFRDRALEAAFTAEQGLRAVRPMRWIAVVLTVITLLAWRSVGRL